MCPAKERVARIVQRNGVAYELVIMCTRYAKNVCKIISQNRSRGNGDGEFLMANLDASGREGANSIC